MRKSTAFTLAVHAAIAAAACGCNGYKSGPIDSDAGADSDADADADTDADADADTDADSDTDADTDTDTETDTTEACWSRVYPPLTDRDIPAVWVFGADDVWISNEGVGSDGAETDVAHFDGSGWTRSATGMVVAPRGFSATAPDDLWAFSVGAELVRFDGTAWQPVEVDFTGSVQALWARAEDDVYVGGDGGLWRFDGAGWAQLLSPSDVGETGLVVVSVFGCGPNDLWVAAPESSAFGQRLYHFDGGAWEPEGLVDIAETGTHIGGACLAADDVYVAADSLYHFDGDAWTDLVAEGIAEGSGWHDVFAESASSVWAVGAVGMIHLDGGAWSAVPLSPQAGLQRVHGVAGGPVFAVGEGGALFRIADDGAEPLNLLAASVLVGLVGDGERIDALSQGGDLLRGDGTGWTRAFGFPYDDPAYLMGQVSGSPSGSLGFGMRLVPAPSSGVSFPELPTLVAYGETASESVDLGAHDLLDMWVSPEGDALFADWDGTVLALDGDALVPLDDQPGAAAAALWGPAMDDLYAWCGSEPGAYRVGSTDTTYSDETPGVTTSVHHYDGVSWTALDAPSLDEIPVDLVGTEADGLYALGRHCGVLHHDGAAWSQLPALGGMTRCDAIAVAGGAVFVADRDQVWRYGGGAWALSYDLSGESSWNLDDIWAADGGEVYAAAHNSTSGEVSLVRYGAGAWSAVETPGTLPAFVNLGGDAAILLAASFDTDSGAGRVFSYDGAAWAEEIDDPNGPVTLLAASGGGLGAAGSDGTVYGGTSGALERHRDGLHCFYWSGYLSANGPDDMLGSCYGGQLIELRDGAWRSVNEGVPFETSLDFGSSDEVAVAPVPRGEGLGYYAVRKLTNYWDASVDTFEVYLYDGAGQWSAVGDFPGEAAPWGWGDGAGGLFLWHGPMSAFTASPLELSHFDGETWTTVFESDASGPYHFSRPFVAEWGDVYMPNPISMYGGGTDILVWDGEALSSITGPFALPYGIASVYAISPNDIYAIGPDDGTGTGSGIYRYHCE